MSKKKQNIEIEIRFEEGNSTRDEQLLSLVKFLRALTDGEIEHLISINGNPQKIQEYQECLQLLDNYIENKEQNLQKESSNPIRVYRIL